MTSLLLWLLAGLIAATLYNNRYRFIGDNLIADHKEVDDIIQKNPEFKVMIDNLEARRKRIKMASDVTSYIIFLVFAWISYLYFTLDGEHFNIKIYMFIIPALPIMFLIKKPFFTLKKFTSDYKHQIMSHLIQTVHPSLGYEQKEVIPVENIESAEMFNILEFAEYKGDKSYKGEDLVYGEIDNVGLMFSDVNAHTGSGKDFKLVFDGTFFVAEFPYSFSGKTFVVPDFSKSGMFSDMVKGDKVSGKKSFTTSGEKIDLNDQVFEEIYDVYSTDKNEVNRIFTESLLKNMVLLDNKSNDKVLVAFSFIENRLSIGMLFNYLKFEPDINVSLKQLKSISYAYHQLITLLHIVENVRSVMEAPKEKTSV